MSNLEIKINEPCHENWDIMSPKAQGRFCESCATDVVDFTTMTDAEVKSYFTNYTGSVCGRFKTSQLQPEKKINYFSLPEYTKKFVRAFALAFIMFSSFEMSAQSNQIVKGRVATCTKKASVLVRGMVYGSDGSVIANAKITLYKKKGLVGEWATDKNGDYNFRIEQGSYQIHIAKKGFADYNKTIQISSESELRDFELKTQKIIPEPRIMGMIKMGKPAINHKAE